MLQIIAGQWQPTTKPCSLFVATRLSWAVSIAWIVPVGFELVLDTCYWGYNSKTTSEGKEILTAVLCKQGPFVQLFVYESCVCVCVCGHACLTVLCLWAAVLAAIKTLQCQTWPKGTGETSTSLKTCKAHWISTSPASFPRAAQEEPLSGSYLLSFFVLPASFTRSC